MRPIVPRPRAKPALPDSATLVADILSFLGEEPERFEQFLAASGLAVSDLRAASTTAGFAEALLDHLCGDDRLLIAFAESRGCEPGALDARRQRLSNPDGSNRDETDWLPEQDSNLRQVD